MAWSSRDPGAAIGFSVWRRAGADRHERVAAGDSVAYGIAEGRLHSAGFLDPNEQYLLSARASGLEPDTDYVYAVGCTLRASSSAHPRPTVRPEDCISDLHLFTTAPPRGALPARRPMKVAIYGDMGVKNARSLPLLKSLAAAENITAVFHVGDLAYDMHEDSGRRADIFLEGISPVAANIPYHVCPGNHEHYWDFAEYRARFDGTMPNSGPGAMFHGFDLGPVHYVMFSSEVYFYTTRHGWGLAWEQHRWLRKHLAAVDRTRTPWLVTMAHRPMYCSPNDDLDDCHHRHSLVRDGVGPKWSGPFRNALGIEHLLQEFKVDLHVGAHEHSYERTWPVYKNVVGAKGPGAYDALAGADWLGSTVHLVAGAAGCREYTDRWMREGKPFSAVRLNGYGFGLLTASNTSLDFEQIDHSTGNIVDRFTITKPADAFRRPSEAPLPAGTPHAEA